MIYFSAIYLFFAVATFGHLFRETPKFKYRHLAAAAAWPLYWIIIHGVAGSMRTLYAVTGETIYFSVGLFTAGFFLARNSHLCTDYLSCGWLALETAAVFLGFPFYWGWLWAN